jgi:hypothetical protein
MGMGFHHSAQGESGPRGEFVLEGIHPGANLMLQAEAGEARSGAPQPAAAGVAEPVKLVISGANTVALRGRVLDSAGKPIAGVAVSIRSRPARRDSPSDPGTVRFEGETAIVTDEGGRYETPRQLRRGFEYRAEVKPDDPGLMSDSSPWLVLRPGSSPILGDLVLRRLRSVEGKVVDSQGQPVAGATVRQSGDGPVATKALTDSSGRFQLSGVLAEPALLFVAKEGYRFTGGRISRDDSAIELTLERSDGPPAPPMRTLPPATTAEQERKLLRLIFDPYAEKVLKEDQSVNRFEVARVITMLDPVRARVLLEEDERRPEPRPPGFDRGELVLALYKQHPNEAIEILAAILDPNWRSYVYEHVSRKVPEPDRAERLRLLNESLLAAQAVKEPAERAQRLAYLGRRFVDLGQSERGLKLLREAQDVARRLPTTGQPAYARMIVAQELAVFDLPAALELMKGTEEEAGHQQHLGHIAHRLAGKDPAATERILRTMHGQWLDSRDMCVHRVCYRMVTVDRERAFNLARGLTTDPRYKARALAAMALALARVGDHDAAKGLLAEAFGVLERLAGGQGDHWDGLSMACTVAAALLPIVEEVDPALVRECLWRALAMRPALRSATSPDWIELVPGVRIAALVARYDRGIARQMLDRLIETELPKLASGGGRDTADGARSLVRAAAFISPFEAGGILSRLPDSADAPGPSLRDQARVEVARVLAVPSGEERSKLLEWRILNTWPYDSEDD